MNFNVTGVKSFLQGFRLCTAANQFKKKKLLLHKFGSSIKEEYPQLSEKTMKNFLPFSTIICTGWIFLQNNIW